MNLVEKVGNIKVYTEKNAEKDISVSFYNGSDCVLRDVYFTDNETAAIENLFTKLDTYTEEWLRTNFSADELEKCSDNTYKTGEKDYFCRIDDTRFFKHFYKAADEFIKDKNGMRIIDR